jgi:outer membrane protein assembly factor BamB
MLSQNQANTAFADITFPIGPFQTTELFEGANEDRSDAPILANDHLLVSRASDGGNPTGVFALNPETGSQRWQNTDYVDYTTPSVYGKTAIISGGGTTAALNIDTGKVHWTQSIGGSGLYKTHLKLEDTIVVSSGTGQNLAGLHAQTGDVQWTSSPFGVIYGLATDGGRIVFSHAGDDESGLVGFDPSSQEVVWTAREPAGVSQPVVGGELVLFTDVDTGTVRAFDIERGEEQWQYLTEDDVSAPPAVDENAGRVFVVGPNSGLHVLELASGELLWNADSPGAKQPLVTQNVVLTTAGESIFQVLREDQSTTKIATPRKSISSPLSLGNNQIFLTARSSEDSGALTYTVAPQT